MGELKNSFFTALSEVWTESAKSPFPTLEEARHHVLGDGLADFARMELETGIDWDDADEGESRDAIAERALDLLEIAQYDLKTLINAIKKWRKTP